MKRILTAAALLLVVAACNKDENYNDKYGDRAVIPPKGQAVDFVFTFGSTEQHVGVAHQTQVDSIV